MAESIKNSQPSETRKKLKDLLKKRFVERSLKNGVLAKRKKKAH
jgi:hypothetical protein